MGKTVKVMISGEMSVRFNQTVEMDEKEFKRLRKMLNGGDEKDARKAEDIIGGFVDRSDVDEGDIEIDDFEVIK